MSKSHQYLFYIVIIILILLILYGLLYVNIKKESFETIDSVTVVSGYWNVSNKYTDSDYKKWFSNTLKINERYVMFLDNKDKELINEFRKNYNTTYIHYPLSDFYTNKYYSNHWINSEHVPSVELGKIWNEKIHLIKLAKDRDIENDSATEYYVWIDAGISIYRNNPPPSKKLMLKDLPKNKLCISSVDGGYHRFSAGILLIHREFIDTFHEIYYNQLSSCDSNEWKCGSEQFVLTKIQDDRPELFHIMGDGYGAILPILYDKQ